MIGKRKADREEIENLEKRIGVLKEAGGLIDWIVRIFLILIIIFVCATLYDTLAPKDKLVDFHNFDKLAKINPDVCAWIKIDDTHIVKTGDIDDGTFAALAVLIACLAASIILGIRSKNEENGKGGAKS